MKIIIHIGVMYSVKLTTKNNKIEPMVVIFKKVSNSAFF
ncbi:hypothetical protein SPONN_1353 [uncultured Candidatus Thioglobus sp.]|nr:hypothetical protein SPONN_1353 [uncultured Candidatus Thioglobus sp.]